MGNAATEWVFLPMASQAARAILESQRERRKMIAIKEPMNEQMTPPPDAFRALTNDFAARLKAGDTAGLAYAFYAEGARLVPSEPYPVTGRGPIERFWQSMVEEGLSEASLETTGVEVSETAAYTLCRYHLAVSRESGMPHEESGICVIMFRRQRDGAWRAAEQVFHRD
jgi:ketosteroid isomerase-like protein